MFRSGLLIFSAFQYYSDCLLNLKINNTFLLLLSAISIHSTFVSHTMDQTKLASDILGSLNANQKEAVTSPCSGVLQIVAGPGTGKTKVLVSRVAYLLLKENVLPQSIIVTTFTKKAANEMMERLREMLKGTEIVVGKLLIGTFHSICFKIIQKYGNRIGIENYAIADDRDALQILGDVLLKHLTDADWHFVDTLPLEQTAPFKSKNDSDKYRGYDLRKLRKKISQLKSTGINSEDSEKHSDGNLFVLLIYSLYQRTLNTNRLLDFDDCLLYCHKIVSRFPVLNYIEHTLVDEFQDTNEIQLQLMYEFAKGHPTNPLLQHNVTIVGDPDQSIYAFRHAQSGNFDKMRQHYLQKHQLPCKITALNENYRSTSDILQISERIMRQQSDRMIKNLRSQIHITFKPMRADLESSDQEARWIAYQIEHLKKFPDSLFEYSDIAILVRSAYQTRVIETELTRKKIPYFMVRGKAFWERKEVVALVDYLRCVANENDRIAFLRCVNFPKRGLGPKALAELDSIIEKQQIQVGGLLVFETLKEISTSKMSCSLGPRMKQSLGQFLDIIDSSKSELNEIYNYGENNLAGMNKFFLSLYAKSGVQKEFAEDVNCNLNLMEVKSQLMDFEMPLESDLPDYVGEDSLQDTAEEITSGTDFLKSFLSLVTLFDTNPETKDGDDHKPKVAISTIHGAKGLEWPVVFVPGVSEGLLPASFAADDHNPESINEERRCFYVATSRAKTLLFVSSYTDGGNRGRRPIDRPSRFLDKLDQMFSSTTPIDTMQKLDKLYEVMGKTRTCLTFDFAKSFKNYELCLKSYVNGDIDSAPAELGFTSVRKLDKLMNIAPTRNFYPKKSATKATGLKPISSVKLQTLKSGSGKAPAYIPMRPAKTTIAKPLPVSAKPANIMNATEIVKPTNSKTNSIAVFAGKRAPAYVPVRSSNKRRLGTR